MPPWKKVKLGEVAEIIKDTYQPSINDDLDYIGLEHIEQQSLRLNSIGKSTSVTSGKFKFKEGDILFGKLRPYFRKVVIPNFSGVCSTDIWVIRARKGFDQKFLFYLLASEPFIEMSSSGSTGTRMPRADWALLKTTEWFFPDLPTQSRIASILSAFDDKIELNRQINKTLEEMAQALFKKYFVTGIDPDNLPEGWKWGKISDICITTSGGTPSRKELKYYDEMKYFWVKSKELNGSFILESEEMISEEGFKNSSTKILPKYSILIAMYGNTTGAYAILGIEATCNQAICALLANDNYPFTFIYQIIKNAKSELISQAVGSAQQNISQVVIQDFEIIIPAINIVKRYHNEVLAIFEKIEANLKEIKQIKNIRDSLLPKLMNGEIPVDSLSLKGCAETIVA